MIIKRFEIAWLYVAFVQGNGGKRRPILVLSDYSGQLAFYAITHQFKNKSAKIQKQYCPILDWNKIAGLTMPSYIDTGKIFTIDEQNLTDLKVTGRLTRIDIINLKHFLVNYHHQKKIQDQKKDK